MEISVYIGFQPHSTLAAPSETSGRAIHSKSVQPLTPHHSKPRLKYLLVDTNKLHSQSHRTSGFPFLSLADRPDRDFTTPCWCPTNTLSPCRPCWCSSPTSQLPLASFDCQPRRTIFVILRLVIVLDQRGRLPFVLNDFVKPYIVKIKSIHPAVPPFLRSVSSPTDTSEEKQTSFSSPPSKKARTQTAIQLQ